MKSLSILSVALSSVALVLSIQANTNSPQTTAIPDLKKQEIAKIVRDEIAANPKMIVDSVSVFAQAEKAKTAETNERKVVEKKADIADAKGFPIIGNPNGTVTLVYFFDSNCPYCKVVDPFLKNIVEKNPDVKIIHREIPILSKTSRLAAHVANIVWGKHPDKYAAYHSMVMAHKGGLTEANIEEILRKSIGNEETTKLLSVIENYETDSDVHAANNRVQENLSIATTAGITGTPLVLVVEADGVIRGAVEEFQDRVQELVVKARSSKH
jgi:protein-disulfide isomerase